MIDWDTVFDLVVQRGIGQLDVRVFVHQLPKGLHEPFFAILHPIVQSVRRSDALEAYRNRLRKACLNTLRARFRRCQTLEDLALALQYQVAVKSEDEHGS